jgi:hypothetical protein
MNLKNLFVLISGIAIACDGKAPTFNWHPAIWATDSRTQLIVRGDERIPTSDPRFDNMICIAKDEPGKAQQACYEVILQCEKWK